MPSDWDDGEIDMSKVQVSQYLPVGVRYLEVTDLHVLVKFNDGHKEIYRRPQRVTCTDILQDPNEPRELPGFHAQSVNGPAYTSWPLEEEPTSALYEEGSSE